ncbi:hypothetical protein GJ496_009009 [Pomphorhynchus laevis]|nr:hypothetical protein GJ496_009009 [Pomphorhynchus laevis]
MQSRHELRTRCVQNVYKEKLCSSKLKSIFKSQEESVINLCNISALSKTFYYIRLSHNMAYSRSNTNENMYLQRQRIVPRYTHEQNINLHSNNQAVNDLRIQNQLIGSNCIESIRGQAVLSEYNRQQPSNFSDIMPMCNGFNDFVAFDDLSKCDNAHIYSNNSIFLQPLENDQNLCPSQSVVKISSNTNLTNDICNTKNLKRFVEETIDDFRSSPVKKKRKPIFVPEDEKDEQYWERRRKNNESAKRSRQARRDKEMQYQLKIAELEEENLRISMQLKTVTDEFNALKSIYLRSANIHIDIPNQETFNN